MTYQEFIEKCKTKTPCKPFHKHHIIPLSAGGPNTPDNIIPLSFSDHWLAHYILARDNPETKIYQKDFSFMGTWEQFIKRSYSQYKAATNPSEENRAKMSHKGESNGMYGTNRSGELAPNYARQFSDEWKRHISEGKKGKPSPKKGVPMSEEQKRKISETLKNRYRGKV